jgi:hypothetical protein
MQSKASTVAQYLEALPADRRAAMAALRAVIRANLGPGYEEGMQYGMIGYYVPHSIFPSGYHCDPKQPLPFAGLASQKGHMSLYLGCVHGGDGAGGEAPEAEWFRQAWLETGKKLDMGKGCVRFKKLEDVPLELVGELIRRVPSQLYIARYTAERARATGAKPPRGAGGQGGAQTKGTPKASPGSPARPAAKAAARPVVKPPAKAAGKATAKATAKAAAKAAAMPAKKAALKKSPTAGGKRPSAAPAPTSRKKAASKPSKKRGS